MSRGKGREPGITRRADFHVFLLYWGGFATDHKDVIGLTCRTLTSCLATPAPSRAGAHLSTSVFMHGYKQKPFDRLGSAGRTLAVDVPFVLEPEVGRSREGARRRLSGEPCYGTTADQAPLSPDSKPSAKRLVPRRKSVTRGRKSSEKTGTWPPPTMVQSSAEPPGWQSSA